MNFSTFAQSLSALTNVSEDAIVAFKLPDGQIFDLDTIQLERHEDSFTDAQTVWFTLKEA